MSPIVLATASAELEQRVHHATGGAFVSLPHGPLPADPAQLFQQLREVPPDVVVLDAGADAMDQALALAAKFDRQCPSISIVLVSDRGSEVGLAAMRAGVRDILHPDADIADIRELLERATEAARARHAATAVESLEAGSGAADGQVIGVVSPKGGAGKTTVATNLAVGLARLVPNSTVLVDLDVQFGDVTTALGLEPEYTLPDAVQGPASRDSMVLKTFLTLHSTGLYVISGAESPDAADMISGAQITRLLQMLASEFRYVVFDTGPGLSEHTLAALDASTGLVLLTSMDVLGVRGLRKELLTLTELGIMPDARQVVLNFADKNSGLTAADVEATIGTGVDLVLPRSKAAPISVNQGIPLMQSELRDPMTTQLRKLVNHFGPAPTPAPAPAARTWRGKGMHRAGAK